MVNPGHRTAIGINTSLVSIENFWSNFVHLKNNGESVLGSLATSEIIFFLTIAIHSKDFINLFYIYSPGHNTLELYNLLVRVRIATNKTKVDILYNKDLGS